MVSSLDEYKRTLVQEIGFGGVLQLPVLTRLNLRFSTWLMSRVDVEGRCIRPIDGRKSIRFWPGDVHKVFGIPAGSQSLNGVDTTFAEPSISFIKTTLGMKGSLVLKSAESIISREISEKNSSNLEKDCFKMAFVIFVMGHLFCLS
jgi:hypothetical protein